MTTETLTVYSKPDCGQCDRTEFLLQREKIPYVIHDITEDDQAMEQVKALGYLQAPVVVTPTEHWSGFRPDKIMSLVA